MELHGNGGQTRLPLPLISHYRAEECLPYSLSPEPENRPPQQSQQLRAPEWVRPATLQGSGQGLCLKPVAGSAVTRGRMSPQSGVGGWGILIPSIVIICEEIKRIWYHSKITFIYLICKVHFPPVSICWAQQQTWRLWRAWLPKPLESCGSLSHKLPLKSHCGDVGRSRLNSEFHGNSLGLTICVVIER